MTLLEIKSLCRSKWTQSKCRTENLSAGDAVEKDISLLIALLQQQEMAIEAEAKVEAEAGAVDAEAEEVSGRMLP